MRITSCAVEWSDPLGGGDILVDSRIFREYISSLNGSLSAGNATEHTHRPALKTLLESIDDRITATNEPARIECGAPDYSTSVNGLTIGYIEAKNIGLSVDAIERDSNRSAPNSPNGEQLKRYRNALPNLILTNYTDFRWYVDGERRLIATLADDDGNGKLITNNDSIANVDNLLSGFFAESPKPVSSPEELALRMARLTHIVHDVVRESLDKGQASSDVNDLYDATKQTLVADLTVEDFADMFAQTLAYGLFAARVNTGSDSFHWSTAATAISTANPFLRQVFDLTAGINAKSEPFIGFVDDLSQLLANSDMEAILSDFGRREALQDPIMHFYETFLAAYDPDLKERRGVYYTPEPVISYIVRSVDHILRERFGCPDGLADYHRAEYETLEDVDGEQKPALKESHRVLVLDPACGTGSFLYAVIDFIREQYMSSNNAGMWDGYVRDNLLPRIFGFELMMAPYAMAHLKLGMQLAAQDMPEEHRAKWAYDFRKDERLKIYLTNSLENAEQQAVGLFGPMRVITEEANAAAEVKRELPIMVVLGNPPYSGHSSNKGEWITRLIEDYKSGFPELQKPGQAKWLQDDYVKFIRFAQQRISKVGTGVVAFVTNHSYLKNPTFRGMRLSLMESFDEIYLLDLHGDANKQEQAPGGSTDQNVFDIRQGVAIGIFVKNRDTSNTPARVLHADLWGEREPKAGKGKYGWLAEKDVCTTQWTEISPKSPTYYFAPRDEELFKEYESGWSVVDIFSLNGRPAPGVITTHDQFAISWTSEEAVSKVERFLSTSSETEARAIWRLCTQDQWQYARAKKELAAGSYHNEVNQIHYRPFDTRYTIYNKNVAVHRRSRVMRHMLDGANIGLITCRQQSESGTVWNRYGVTNDVLDECSISNKTREINYLFPLYIYPSEQEIAQGLYESGFREPNLSPEFIGEMEGLLGLSFVADGSGDLDATFGPEDVLYYIYAVFHSPEYRELYDQFLRADFPRVPLTKDIDLFRVLVGLGSELTDVHLLRASIAHSQPVAFPIPGENTVERAHPKFYAPGETPEGETAPVERGRVYISRSKRRPVKQGQYFEGVTPEVWESRFGGYQPMDKWLKDRKGRALSFEDITHYQRIAAALQETLRLTAEVDAAVVDAGMFG